MINSFRPILNQHADIPNNKVSSLPTRDEIANEFKWNLNDIYANEEEFKQDISEVQNLITKLNNFQGTLDKPSSLKDCLRLQDNLEVKISSLFAYARMSRDTDAKNPHYQSLTSQIESLLAEAASACAFIEPELLSLPLDYLKTLVQKDSNFKIYQFYFEDLLRQKEHVLSPTEEMLLAKTSELMKVPTNTYTILTNADLVFPQIINETGEKVQLSEGRYNSLIRSKDRTVRKSAFINLFATYATFRNTFATLFSSNIKNTIFYTKAKKYKSTLHAALENTNVPIDVYTNLINTVHDNLHLLHQYTSLKKDFLKLDQIHMYDLYVSLAKESNEQYSYEDGLKLVLESLKPLGQQYIDDLLKGVNNGWVDIYENQGKRTGAYSWGVFGVHPFVLLNYDNRYGSVSTLAHELGHAMHSYYSNKHQAYRNSSYTIFCAEVASTTNEILLLDHMLELETDPTKRIYFINQYLEQVRTTVYRQAMFAEFELLTHAKAESGETLTADLLETIWLDLNRKYYGDEIILDDEIKIEWARIPHFYRPFYVYQYVTGYAAATTLAENLSTQVKCAQKRYLDYLKSGGSAYSIDLLKIAGVDMSQPLPLQITLSKFAKRLSELKKLLGKA